MVFCIKLDADIIATCPVRRDAGGAGPGEGVQHEISGLRKGLDQWFQDVDGFLCRVVLVARVGPVHDIGQGVCRERRVSLQEQIGSFVPVLQERCLGCIAFAEDDMAADAESGLFPRGEEQVHFRPAVEADSTCVVFEYAIYFGEGRGQPRGVIVVA